MMDYVPVVALDREEVPPPYATFERPYIYRTYQVEGKECGHPDCSNNAHVGIVEPSDLNEDQVATWLEQGDDSIRVPVAHRCAVHYLGTVSGTE